MSPEIDRSIAAVSRAPRGEFIFFAEFSAKFSTTQTSHRSKVNWNIFSEFPVVFLSTRRGSTNILTYPTGFAQICSVVRKHREYVVGHMDSRRELLEPRCRGVSTGDLIVVKNPVVPHPQDWIGVASALFRRQGTRRNRLLLTSCFVPVSRRLEHVHGFHSSAGSSLILSEAKVL